MSNENETQRPCCPGALFFAKGDILVVHSVEWGHLFCKEGLPGGPSRKYPFCAVCGKPWNVVRDEMEKAQEF